MWSIVGLFLPQSPNPIDLYLYQLNNNLYLYQLNNNQYLYQLNNNQGLRTRSKWRHFLLSCGPGSTLQKFGELRPLLLLPTLFSHISHLIPSRLTVIRSIVRSNSIVLYAHYSRHGENDRVIWIECESTFRLVENL